VEAGLDLSAPSQENDQTERRRSKQPQRQIPKSEFGWLAGEQTYPCPQGHRLTRIGHHPFEGGSTTSQRLDA